MRLDPTSSLEILKRELDAVGASDEDYVLFGSMGMWFEGLRNGVGDIDVFVKPYLWTQLRARDGWEVETPREDDPSFLSYDALPPIHVFYAWNTRDKWMSVEACYNEAKVSSDGWKYAPLTEIIKWKKEARRFKDIWDIEKIERRLKGKHARTS